MDKELYDYLMRWMALHQEWQDMLVNGIEPSKMTDGQRLNGIRNQLNWVLTDLEEAGYTLSDLMEEAAANGFDLENSMKELPPEMAWDYMKDKELVCRNAGVALACYHTNPDYLYIREQLPNLSAGSDAEVLHRIENEIAFVHYLEIACERGRYAYMKLYSDTKKYLPRLRYAKELLAMRIDYLQPFS